MKNKIIDLFAATLGLILAPIWLPMTLLLYLIKWLKKGR